MQAFMQCLPGTDSSHYFLPAGPGSRVNIFFLKGAPYIDKEQTRGFCLREISFSTLKTVWPFTDRLNLSLSFAFSDFSAQLNI